MMLYYLNQVKLGPFADEKISYTEGINYVQPSRYRVLSLVLGMLLFVRIHYIKQSTELCSYCDSS